jgi:hypothetical protein
MLQPATLPESLLDRAKRLSKEMAIHKQNARKKQKREQSKLRYNKQREEIPIDKKQHYKEHREEKQKIIKYTVMKKFSNKKNTTKRTAIK